jgi:hypothetical protein
MPIKKSSFFLMPGRFGFVLTWFDLINGHSFNLQAIFLKFRTG